MDFVFQLVPLAIIMLSNDCKHLQFLIRHAGYFIYADRSKKYQIQSKYVQSNMFRAQPAHKCIWDKAFELP